MTCPDIKTNWDQIRHEQSLEVNRKIWDLYFSITGGSRETTSLLIEIRSRCASWIEGRDWSWVGDVASYHEKCSKLLKDFCDQLALLLTDIRYMVPADELIKKLNLDIEKKDFKFVQDIYSCLEAEKSILLGNEINSRPLEVSPLQVIKTKINQNVKLIIQISANFDQFCAQSVMMLNRNNISPQAYEQCTAQSEQYRQLIVNDIDNLLAIEVIGNGQILNQLDWFRDKINSEIRGLRRTCKRRIALDSAEFKLVIGNTQDLASCIWSLLSCLEAMNTLAQNSQFRQFDRFPNNRSQFDLSVRDLFQKLLNQSLIMVEVNPVITSPPNKRPLSTISVLLLLDKTICERLSKVTIKLIHENQAKDLFNSDPNSDQTTKIDNNEVSFKFDEESCVWKAEFDKLLMYKIEKRSKAQQASVLDVKHAWLLSAKCFIGNDLHEGRPVQSISEPIVVNTNTIQNDRARATIFWDKHFAPTSRTPFEVPHSVPFKDLAAALDKEWNEVTGAGLYSENLDFLAQKLLGDSNASMYDERMVTMQMFAHQEHVGDPNSEIPRYTFWQWFYAALDLLDQVPQLKKIWCDWLLYGFVSKSQVRDMLLATPDDTSTVLLFFSEKIPGTISLAYKTNWYGQPGQPIVLFTNPEKADFFRRRSLAERIRDFVDLGMEYLYPNRPINDAFLKFYSPEMPPIGPDNPDTSWVEPRDPIRFLKPHVIITENQQFQQDPALLTNTSATMSTSHQSTSHQPLIFVYTTNPSYAPSTAGMQPQSSLESDPEFRGQKRPLDGSDQENFPPSIK